MRINVKGLYIPGYSSSDSPFASYADLLSSSKGISTTIWSVNIDRRLWGKEIDVVIDLQASESPAWYQVNALLVDQTGPTRGFTLYHVTGYNPTQTGQMHYTATLDGMATLALNDTAYDLTMHTTRRTLSADETDIYRVRPETGADLRSPVDTEGLTPVGIITTTQQWFGTVPLNPPKYLGLYALKDTSDHWLGPNFYNGLSLGSADQIFKEAVYRIQIAPAELFDFHYIDSTSIGGHTVRVYELYPATNTIYTDSSTPIVPDVDAIGTKLTVNIFGRDVLSCDRNGPQERAVVVRATADTEPHLYLSIEDNINVLGVTEIDLPDMPYWQYNATKWMEKLNGNSASSINSLGGQISDFGRSGSTSLIGELVGGVVGGPVGALASTVGRTRQIRQWMRDNKIDVRRGGGYDMIAFPHLVIYNEQAIVAERNYYRKLYKRTGFAIDSFVTKAQIKHSQRFDFYQADDVVFSTDGLRPTCSDADLEATVREQLSSGIALWYGHDLVHAAFGQRETAWDMQNA